MGRKDSLVMVKKKKHTKSLEEERTDIDSALINDKPKKDVAIILLVGLLGLIYFVYSFFSKGVYQHDEISHFLSMQDFWNEPNGILSNWSKPGYKLIYVLPVLLGLKFVTFINCIMCALSVYFSYKILKGYNSKYAILAVFFLGLTPIWFQLSFRNYAEFSCVFMLVLALFYHQKGKFLFAALLVSYASFVRQEAFLITGLYFWYLLFKKEFFAALLTGTFALVLYVWGYATSGNLLFLFDYLFGYASKISGAYLQQRGLQRIPSLTTVLFGAITPLLFIVYCGASFLQKKKLHYFILVPLLSLYAYYAIGDATWFSKGIPVNTRQLLINAPFLAIIAVLGLDRFSDLSKENKKWMLVFIIPYLILVGLYMSKTHNWVVLLDEENYIPLLVSLAAVLALYIPTKVNTKVLMFSLIALFSMTTSFKKFKMTEEDRTMKRIADYYVRVCKSKDGVFNEKSPVYYSHELFAFYQERSRTNFNPKAGYLTEESVKHIPKGSIIFWDSHYSYRAKEEGKRLKESYFTDRPNEFRPVNTFQSKDNRVRVAIFYKTNDSDPIYEKGVELVNEKKYQESIDLFKQSLSKNPNSHSAYYYLGLAYQNIGDPNLALQNYSLCLNINPNYKDALFNRGALYTNYSKFNEALKDMNAYVKLNSQNANAYFYLGNIYYGLKNFDQAIQYYNAVLKFNSEFAQSYHNIGLAQIGKNDKANACVSFNKAKSLGHSASEEQIKQYCQ